MRSNKTYISSFTAGLATGSDSHEVPFYRVNAPSSDGFIGEGSNGTRGKERVSASTFRFFAGAKSPSLRSHAGCQEPGLKPEEREKKKEGGGGSGEDLPPRYETPEDQFRDTDTTTKNMETSL